MLDIEMASRKHHVLRTRTKNLMVRLSDREREMLDAVATREQMSASEVVRWLVRREFERDQRSKPAKRRRA